MLIFRTVLSCILFIGSVGTSYTAPLDSPDTIYIDGLPCNRACQSYMAWSRQSYISRQVGSVSGQRAPGQLVEPRSRNKAPHATNLGERGPTRAPTRMAKKGASKPIELPSANVSEVQRVDAGEAKSAPPETTTGALPIPSPAPSAETATIPAQVATAPAVEAPAAEASTTQAPSPAPEENAASSLKPSGPAEVVSPADAEMTALAPPNHDDQLIAILLVRLEIKSASDLANRTVAIDVVRSDSVSSIRTAIVAAGAADVQMSSGSALALERVMDGEVSAAVLDLTSPEAAQMWGAGIKGFNILLIPLSSPSGKERRR